MAAIITKGASLGETAALSQDAKAAENAGNYFFGIVGSVPGVVENTATATSKDSKVSPGQAFTREVFAGWAGYIATGATDVLVTGLLSAAGLTFGAPVIVGATAIAAGYAVTKYLSSEIEKSDAIANAAEKAAAAAASSTADSDPISNRQYALDDGSLVTVQTDGTLNIQTALGTYQYDAGGNPFSYTDTAGVSLSYDSVTGQITGVNTASPLEGLLTIGPDGIQITDQSTGVDVGTLSVDSSGSFQLSQTGVGTLTVPNTQSNQDISFAKDNGDGTTTTTTLAADGNSVATTEVDANGNVLLTSLTDISNGTNQSTTSFMDADGNFLGSLQTTSTVGTDSTTTVSSQLDASGLLIGTTSTITSNDGSSEVNSKDSQGNTLSEQIIASDGSAVVTTFNSLTDPNLNSTVSKDSNGDIFETSTTVAGDTPGSYVSTTLDANGALIEKETRTTDDSGTTDSQAYYEGGRLSSTSDIAADGSRIDTQYEDSSDPKITQSSHFDDNGDLVSQSSTQKNESDGSYLTTSTNPSGQTLSTLVEQADGSMTQTIFNNPNDANLKTVIENDAQGDLVGVSTTTAGTDSDYLTVRQNGDGETTGTDKTNITYDDQGQKNEHIQSYDANGVPTGSSDEVTSPNGHVSDTINGTGVGADLNNSTITLAPDAQANLVGTGNDVTIDNGASLVSQASDGTSGSQQGNQFTLSSGAILIDYEGNSTVADIITQTFGSTGANVTLDGGVATTELSGATITTKDGTTLMVVGDNNCVDGNCTVAIDGDGNQFTLHAGDIASINGNDNTANAVGDGAQLSVAGANNSVDATNGIITLADGTSTTLTGDDNQLSVGSDVAATIVGTDNTGTLNGSGSTITAGDDFTLSMAGASNNDTISVGANGTVSIASGDQGEVINLMNGILNLGSNVGVTSDGVGGNTISAGADDSLVANNDTISFSGGGDSISGAGDTISASDDSLLISNGGGGASDVVIGDSNTISAVSSAITLDSMNEVVSGNADTINLLAGSSATLTSYGDSISLEAGASLISDGYGYNTINAGVDDTVVIGATAGSQSFFTDTLNAIGDQSVTLDSGVAINVVGGGDTITAGGGDSVTASDDTLNLSAGDYGITGAGDTISASGDSLYISNGGGGASDVITGDNNSISANSSAITLNGAGETVTGAFDTLALTGAGESISGNYDSVSFGADTTASMTSYGDSISLGAGSSLTSVGDGFNTIYATSDDAVTIGGTVNSGYYFTDNLHVTDDQNITLESGSSVDVVGSGDTIAAGGGDSVTASDDTLNLSAGGYGITGADDTISASGDSLYISNGGGGASDVITGDNDSISANSSAITLNGAGETVTGAFDTLALTGAGESISGNYDSVSFGADTTASMTSYGDSISLGAGSSLTSVGDGFNTIYATSDDAVTIGGTVNSGYYFTDNLHVTDDQNITLESGSSVDVVGSGDTIAAGGGDSVTASNDTLNLSGSGDAIGGAGDTIAASGESLSISNGGGGASDVIIGDNNTVSASNSAITFGGSGESLSGSNNAISVTAGNSLTVSGAQNVVSGSSDQITLSGDGSSLVVQGNKDNFAVTGTNDRIIDDRTDGTSVLYNWNNSGFETETVYSGSDDSGDIIGGYGYSGTGSGVDVPGGYGGGDGGGYGFAGSPSVVSSALSRDIGSIAQYDLTHGNLSAADAAQSALHQAVDTANSTPTVSAGSSVLESAKWDQQVITWSLADTQGAQVAPFSGFMGSEDESVVQAAFNAWGAADPGLVFKEVSDSAQSDIRVGFGDFNTATTGVVGYTSFQTDDGQMESGVVVRVEDPTQDSLTTGPDGQQTYAGTDATLSQVLQHEIGHALGLGDNADQNSVMNYQLTASNRTLDRTDLAGIGSLYGSGPSTASVGSSGVSQLIQAMSTFNADAGVADTTLLPPASLNNNVILSASAHAA
ncbi:matrixin family metalloprotease [Pseudomonas gingeri]|uniref:matrixin family metalloprotease n=1 Tax=Pseudomonas gingeri TaxID=117681 RepID=UPI0015A4AAC4|nr:matrixin family metalloprotease [Pseudomonas gingeri]NWA24244.1 matrixin family metalloprotease [Pseudomonas gingeri]